MNRSFPSPIPPGPEPHANPALEQRRFLSQLLSSSSLEIASKAALIMLERWEDIAIRYRPQATERWKDNFQARVADLSCALIAGRPEAFVDQVRWSRVAFESRGVPIDDLQRSIDVLGEVLEHFVPPEDQMLVESYVDAAGKALYEPVAVVPSRLSVDSPRGELAAKYLLSILEGDRLAASTLVLDAVRCGMISVPEAYSEVLEPVQHELGRMWHLNDLSVAEEHFATQTTKMVISQLYPYMKRAPRNGKTVLAGCVEGNSHDIGMRIVADHFEMAGWRAIYLGANVPVEDMPIAADHFAAHVMCLSGSMLTHLRAIEETIATCRAHASAKKTKILVGGAAFQNAENLWREVGADGIATGPVQAVVMAHQLLGLSPPPKP